MARNRIFLLLALLPGISAFFFACGGSDANTAATQKPGLRGDITVFAASSLTDAFKEIGAAFEASYPGTNVAFNFASSAALATQINAGAPADVFAAADTVQMQVVLDHGNASTPDLFATNVPVVVVPNGSGPVASFEDLTRPGARLVLAAPEVPIGNYARQVLANASKAGGVSPDFSTRVLANLRSNEANVRGVLAKVQTGEADAGIVYSTDATLVPRDIRVIAIPGRYNILAVYPIATVKGSSHADVAAAFVEFVLSPPGQSILARYGFGKAGQP